MNENDRQRDYSFHPCCMIAAVVALVAWGFLEAAFCIVGSAVVIALHELTHAAVARALGIRIRKMRVLPWRGYTRFAMKDKEALTGRFLAVAVAGPLAGLASASIAYAAAGLSLPFALAGALMLLSLALCGDTVVNLLPVWRFDGKLVSNALAAICKRVTSRAEAVEPGAYVSDRPERALGGRESRGAGRPRGQRPVPQWNRGHAAFAGAERVPQCETAT